MKRPVALIILDGWGVSDSCVANAVCQAQTPRLRSLAQSCPSATLEASGQSVGLPDGQMGNSEVGHLNIGAGRIIYQDLTRISLAIEQGDFFTNPAFLDSLQQIRAAGGRLHLMGLLSDGGVHSHNTHLYALVELARQQGVEACIHAFMDGRDTPPQSGGDYLAQLEAELTRIGHGRVASVIGRYYAMDRDNRWERVERAWQAMVLGTGQAVASSAEAISSAYAAGQTDEFIEPRIIQSQGRPAGRVADGDGIIFFNFRSDRAREITRSFTQPGFDGFARQSVPQLASFVCLTEYDETFDLPIAFPSETYPNLLGEVVAQAGRHQLRIAETEKYAHVTFFFNGGLETPFEGEDRILVPSPKVATYDLQPEMSAPEVTDKLVEAIKSGKYDLVVCNYANGDMVGHTGKLDAAIKAAECLDTCVRRVCEALEEVGGQALITADHGNCEQMTDPTSGQVHTAHTIGPVPLVYVGPQPVTLSDDGSLSDVAPSLLTLMGLDQPAEMTGHSLVKLD